MNTIVANKDRRFNAVKHGVMQKALMPEEYRVARQIYDSFVAEYKPATFTERLLVETMMLAYLRRQRALFAEREFFLQVKSPPVYEEKVISMGIMDGREEILNGIKEMVLVSGHVSEISGEQVDVADKTLARYVTTCERQFYRAMHELQRIQAVRKDLRPTSVAVDSFTDDIE